MNDMDFTAWGILHRLTTDLDSDTVGKSAAPIGGTVQQALCAIRAEIRTISGMLDHQNVFLDEANFSEGDNVFVRTEQTLSSGSSEPQTELAKIKSMSSGSILLGRPLAYD
ncbi:MAG: hypothetical protein P8J20_03165 [Novosphingobium sp.]|nr:hypothetical protein [Novosphingobium sp.]